MGTFVENVNLIATGIQQVYDNLPEILLADDNAAICTAMASVCTSTYDQFDDRYLGAKATAPLVDNDGNALVYGTLYFDTTQNFMKVWSNAGWINAGSSVNGTTERYTYSATAGQTVFVATYEAGYIDVFLNGSKLQNGVDFTAVTATDITLTSPASVGDIVDIICYAVFELSTAPTKDVVTYTVATVADLATIPSIYTTAIVKDLDRGGTFIWSSTGTVNGGTVFAGATGFWTRQYSGAVNVKWFGAKGDGVANDTASIQSAIDFACISGDGEVNLGVGTYKTTATITDYNTVPATENGHTIRLIGVGSSEVDTDTPLSKIITSGGIVGIKFNGNRSGGENFIIEGDNGTADGASHGIVSESSRAQWKNVVSKKHRGDGFKFVFGNNSLFESITCLSNKGNGFNVDGTGYITPAGVSRPNDANASTFINIDCRTNGLKGVITGANSTFANNYYNTTCQGNTGYGIELNGDLNNFFGVYGENNDALSVTPSDIVFSTTADYNYMYGVYSNYNGITANKYRDDSTNKRNYIATLNDFSAIANIVALEIGNKASGISGYLKLAEGATNYELTLEGTSASMLIDMKSSGAGTLNFLIEPSIAPTLLNSWVNYGGTRTVAGYYKDKFKMVHLEGVIKSGTTTVPTILFQLPVGYRPSTRRKFATVSNALFASIFIDSDGNVYYESGSNVEFSLDGICFRVA